jgi:hypothetical protein
MSATDVAAQPCDEPQSGHSAATPGFRPRALPRDGPTPRWCQPPDYRRRRTSRDV